RARINHERDTENERSDSNPLQSLDAPLVLQITENPLHYCFSFFTHRFLGEESLLTARFQFLPSPLNAWCLSPPFTPPSLDSTAPPYAHTPATPHHSRPIP